MAKLTDASYESITPVSSDLVYVVDVSDTTDDPTGSSKKTTVGNLLSLVSTSPLMVGTVVCSSDQPADVQAAVTAAGGYVCDGTADQVQINSAITDASTATGTGLVWLTGGRFYCSGSILMKTAVWLRGSGWLTQLIPVSLTAATGSGTRVGLIKCNDSSVHACQISDLSLYGNWASGGTGDGIYLLANSDDYTGVIDTDPDPDFLIHDLLITGFGNGTTRDGIHMGLDSRGTIINNVQIRSVSRYGIFMEDSPDSHITNVHIGTVGTTGFQITGGNVKMTSCKAYYCDSWGFDIQSGRGQLIGCESQDNANGVRIGTGNVSVAGLIVDTSDVTGLSIAGNYSSLHGITIFNRSSGRYPNTNTGIVFSGTPNHITLTAVVDPSDVVSTAFSGTTSGTANFIRVSHTGGLLSVG